MAAPRAHGRSGLRHCLKRGRSTGPTLGNVQRPRARRLATTPALPPPPLLRSHWNNRLAAWLSCRDAWPWLVPEPSPRPSGGAVRRVPRYNPSLCPGTSFPLGGLFLHLLSREFSPTWPGPAPGFFCRLENRSALLAYSCPRAYLAARLRACMPSGHGTFNRAARPEAG
jgi:hypothetical protein